ncbi:MAG: nitroreductase/quinone reductase family protein [Acidimicrobiia bacterium]
MSFDPKDLLLLDEASEVHIETKRADGRSHRTIIWIVVDEGEVFVRSVRGQSGKWYQRARAEPEVVIHAGGRQIPAKAHLAADEDSVERTNAALRRKYRPGGSLNSMLRPETHDTTMRLDPV